MKLKERVPPDPLPRKANRGYSSFHNSLNTWFCQTVSEREAFVSKAPLSHFPRKPIDFQMYSHWKRHLFRSKRGEQNEHFTYEIRCLHRRKRLHQQSGGGAARGAAQFEPGSQGNGSRSGYSVLSPFLQGHGACTKRKKRESSVFPFLSLGPAIFPMLSPLFPKRWGKKRWKFSITKPTRSRR